MVRDGGSSELERDGDVSWCVPNARARVWMGRGWIDYGMDWTSEAIGLDAPTLGGVGDAHVYPRG